VEVNGAPVTEAALYPGQQFRMGTGTWQVGEAAPNMLGVLDSLASRINQLASTEKLEGFSLRQMFSEVFKKRTPEEVEEYFVTGTSRTTPRIQDVQTGWPKPWFFMRVLLFVGLVYLGFALTMQEFRNEKLIPGLIMMGSLAVPLATVFLFFELNTPRNVSFHSVLMLVCSGGVVSLFVSLIGFSISNLDWLGASQAGIVEEAGKLIAVMIMVRQAKYKYTLNGMLFGAAVGAGFAAFESAGYAFEALLRYRSLDAMTGSIQVRAFLSPFGHVAWTAITAGALWRSKGDQPLNPKTFDARFWKAFLIPVVLHMTWNSPLPSPMFVKHLLLGVLGWFVVFGFVQQGLRQVRDEQLRATRDELRRTQTSLSGFGVIPGARAGQSGR
jgi:RsiW-degrading membrane proteinase PrsW (M82 family)